MKRLSHEFQYWVPKSNSLRLQSTAGAVYGSKNLPLPMTGHPHLVGCGCSTLNDISAIREYVIMQTADA